MELEQFSEAVDIFESTIAEFPIGAKTSDDFKPIEQKIIDLKETLKFINARHLTLKAIYDTGISSDSPDQDLNESLKKLNEGTTNYLINTKALKLCYQSRAIQDIVYKNAGTPEIQEKVKACLNKLFIVNDRLAAKNEKRKELMKKQYHLKLECQCSIYDHQDFLKEQEARRNRELQETNPQIIEYKEKINRSILKICTMKKLITNLIAAMSEELYDNEELINMLEKHKDIINIDYIIELTQSQNLGNNS